MGRERRGMEGNGVQCVEMVGNGEKWWGMGENA